MKKFYAFCAAALMSASLFAADAPTAADLAKEYDLSANVVFCIHPIEDAAVCSDIYFVGTSNNWGKGSDESADPSWDNCEKFMPVTGFEGWYAAELPYSDGFEGKPLQMPKDGAWAWDYQCGDKDAWVYVGGGELNITAGYSDECNIKMAAAGAYIYDLKYWKKHNTPCGEIVKHDYEIVLYAPDACETEPAIIGDFNGWSAAAKMNEDMDDDFNTIYTIKFNEQEGHGFKIVAYPGDGEAVDWNTQIWHYNEEDDVWEEGKNYELGAEEKVVLDWGDNELHRFGNCKEEEQKENVIVRLKAPAGAPEAVEVIGSFDGWTGTAMLLQEDGTWAAIIDATSDDTFKFRTGIGEDSDAKWQNQIQVLKDGNWGDMDNLVFKDHWAQGEGDFADYKIVELDFSDGASYKWTLSEAQGIESVVLTEKANKVVVNGVIYIVRDNKVFNLQGAQVR